MKTYFAMLALFCAVGCGPHFEAKTPSGFVELDDDSSAYDYRSTSADGVVMAVRELDHEPKGEPEFWVTAIKNRMRERGGYALIEQKPVQSADGVKGTQLRFGHDEDSGKPHLYYVTLFVTEDALFLLEAGGTKDLMTANAKKLDQAIREFSTQ
ncbi:MAG TPA: serine/threonine protein kinase [Polyangiaceae bacterium]|jgi:hypothetical protein|nr:serine/threonine protein kinase [Polyangiaceae bacterium]